MQPLTSDEPLGELGVFLECCRSLSYKRTPRWTRAHLSWYQLALVARAKRSSSGGREQMRRSRDQLRNLAAKLQAAREEERVHLARELHDELGQTLTSLKLELLRFVAVIQRLPQAPTTLDRIQSLIGLTEISLETTRRIATDLRPPALDHLGLPEAIRWEASAFQSRTGIRCRLVANGRQSKLTEVEATGVFRIFQEAIANVVRHAEAGAVRILLRENDEAFLMSVKDNGRGITARKSGDPGALGLVGMRERARLLGGTLEISGKKGKGTAVVFRMPVGRARPADAHDANSAR